MDKRALVADAAEAFGREMAEDVADVLMQTKELVQHECHAPQDLHVIAGVAGRGRNRLGSSQPD
ncbi:MAG: hypothetical protein ACR2PG_03405 [Hyphomicrobiaceae bacterium]